MRINEIFRSIDGEVNRWGQGCQSIFIRFQGCNLNCFYCDTRKALDPCKGEEWLLVDVLNKVEELKVKKVTITGGEPLTQLESFKILADDLLKKRYKISVETNGTIEIPRCLLSSNICWVVDWKLGFAPVYQNYRYLKDTDFVKIVVNSRQDMNWSKSTIRLLREGLACKACIALSPAEGLKPHELLDWMKGNDLNDVYLNIQVHKLIRVA